MVIANDYGPYAQYVNSSAPPAPAYAVIPGSVSYDPAYNGNVHDFCMLEFNAPANTPSIPVAVPGNDGLSIGVTVEYVGYGDTQNYQNNTVRMHVSAPVDQAVTSDYFRYSEGGSTHIGGPCDGDFGGPALLAAGAAQSLQQVVGVTSYGDPNCSQYGVSMRVTSATGPGGFISNYLDGSSDGGSSGDAASDATANDAAGDSTANDAAGDADTDASDATAGDAASDATAGDAASDAASDATAGDAASDAAGDAASDATTGDAASDATAGIGGTGNASSDSGASDATDDVGVEDAGGAAASSSGKSGGCGCATVGRSPTRVPDPGLLLLAAFAVPVARRRRRPG